MDNITLIASKIRVSDNRPVNVRIFGSKDCKNCKSAITVLQLLKLSYKFIDAFAEEQQKLCDDNDVNQLPHIQILKENDVVWQKHGDEAIGEFVQIIKKSRE